mgnify:CR=1 FL=1
MRWIQTQLIWNNENVKNNESRFQIIGELNNEKEVVANIFQDKVNNFVSTFVGVDQLQIGLDDTIERNL